MNGLTRIDRETAIMIAGIAGRNVSIDEQSECIAFIVEYGDLPF